MYCCADDGALDGDYEAVIFPGLAAVRYGAVRASPSNAYLTPSQDM